MPNKPTKWTIAGTAYTVGPGGTYIVPEPRGTVERWSVARMLQKMADEAREEAIRLHNPEEILCPECKTPAFRGVIPDGYGNTIPCWRCNLAEAGWLRVLNGGRMPKDGLLDRAKDKDK